MSPELIRLPGGRRLAYSEYGEPTGPAIVNCHGGLTSRLDIGRCEPAAREAGVRVISPDRPGVGRSDRAPGRRLLDWPADAAALADRLELGRFAVIGWSAGGPYAAACAFALPARVAATALIAPAIPADWSGMEREINLMDRTLMRLAVRAPQVNQAALRAVGFAAARAPDLFRRVAAASLDGPSRTLVMSADARQFADPIAEGLRDPRGALDDYRILQAPWGFDPGDIAGPVAVWQGTADNLLPPVWSERLAGAIPGAELHLCHGEGHFLSAVRHREIFEHLRGLLGGPPPA